MFNARWINYHMNLAQAAKIGSKDGSTKVGAILVRPDKSTASTGFNGFPANIDDNPETLNNPQNRELKLLLMAHAETNCIANAKEDPQGYSLFVTHHPCRECAKAIAQNKIKEVYYLENQAFEQRWDTLEAKTVFSHAKINLFTVIENPNHKNINESQDSFLYILK